MPPDDQHTEPATSRAYHALEQIIVTLELAPASITTEGALIERLELGRTPVREAIQRLAWEGLIEVRPRSGLAIAPLKAEDWPLVVDARFGVEVVLARSAAKHAPADATERLRLAAKAMEHATQTGNVVDFLEADKLVDETIAAAAENSYATRVAMPLQTHSRRFWYRYRSEAGLIQSAQHHLAVVHAILAGNEAAAATEAERLMSMLRRLAKEAARR